MNKKESNLICRVSGGSIPKYAHAADAGADLTASQTILIPPRDRLLVTTGIRLEIPCLLYTSPSPRDATLSRMPSSA